MSTNRSISTRKIIQTILTIVLLGGTVFALLSTSKIQEKKKISGVKIDIKNEQVCQFVNKEAIQKELFGNRHIIPEQITIGKIDLKKMENILTTNPWVEGVEIFVDNQQKININVSQRVPQARVFERNGDTYYLDNNVQKLPISEHYNHYEIVFVNVPEMKNDSLSLRLKRKMINIATTIKADSFWQAQTAEIIVNSTKDIQLIPVFGQQKILLGDAKNLEEQLENLLMFYKKIQNKIGWDKYQVLDARFKNQIVASPSLPWKAPVDRALSNMNWVKTIVGETKKQ